MKTNGLEIECPCCCETIQLPSSAKAIDAVTQQHANHHIPNENHVLNIRITNALRARAIMEITVKEV